MRSCGDHNLGKLQRWHHNLEADHGDNMEVMRAQALRHSSVTTCVVAQVVSSSEGLSLKRS